jgi:hypothetical protein
MQHVGVTSDLDSRRLDVAAETSEHSWFGDADHRVGAIVGRIADVDEHTVAQGHAVVGDGPVDLEVATSTTRPCDSP